MRSLLRHRQILACAKKVFAERGFHAANISHICAEAGIGRGTLYQYFRNKKAVFTAILREALERVEAHMQERRLGEMPPPESLTREGVVTCPGRRLRELLGAVFEDDATLRIVLREAVGLDVDIERLVGAIDERLIGLVEADLRAGQRAGVVKPLDPRATATLMVGGVEKLALTALRGDAPLDLDALSLAVAKLHATGILSDRVPDTTVRESYTDQRGSS